MSRRTRTFAALLATAMLVLMVGAGPASASFHLMKIRSIFRGPSPSGAFIELQMYADGQNLVGGHQLRVYPASGTIFSAYNLPANVASGQNQRRILLGDTAAPGSPDFTLAGLGTDLTNFASGGAVCWETIDCVSWGNRTGALPSPAGTPIAGGLSNSQVSVRNITRGCPTALDVADDTDDSAADFGFAVGYPLHNNSVAPTEVLCPSSTTPTTAAKKKCKKHKKKTGAYSAKKKKCKKKKHH
jgi:hypothetical protein